MTSALKNQNSDTTEPANNRHRLSDRSVPALTIVTFIAGLAMMLVAAANLPNLAEWADRWGNVPVFFVFFLFMMLGGGWFSAGLKALFDALRGKNA